MWPVTQEHALEPTVLTAMALGAIARQALGSPDAARQALEHALGLIEADDVVIPMPVPDARWPQRSGESLTYGESRVLNYLPTHLSAREIAAELYLSTNTVKTHQRHLYQKLGAHTRAEAVERARTLGLLTSPATGGRHMPAATHAS